MDFGQLVAIVCLQETATARGQPIWDVARRNLAQPGESPAGNQLQMSEGAQKTSKTLNLGSKHPADMDRYRTSMGF